MPLFVLAIGAGVGYGVNQLMTTPSLAVREIRVGGTRLITPHAVRLDAAQALGKNILALKTSAIALKVEKRPEVKSVEIGRRLPKTIILRVTERTPFVNVTNGSGIWLADARGLPFHRVNAAKKSIPTVMLPAEVTIVAGRKVAHTGLDSAIRCIESGPELAGRIAKISVDRAGNLCLNIGSDFYVKLGQPIEIPQKMRELTRMLAAQPEIGDKVEYINLSCYDRPAIKPKPAPESKSDANT